MLFHLYLFRLSKPRRAIKETINQNATEPKTEIAKISNTFTSPLGKKLTLADFYHGDGESAKLGLEKILEGKSWTSFGYIAAEVDYLKF